ncbi:MAG: SAM-dependent methyltransferase [Mogibacterium sp.]|nr:SAM-dependent methyltransferase [Mogibacterium sp.]
MRLSKRIYALCDSVQKGESVADVGTDHGYVPMLLLKNGISPFVIMSDISEGSLSKAIHTFDEAGLRIDKSSFRLGDGLNTIGPGEVDDVIIAGLGGLTISEILDNDISQSKSFKKIIMQPRKHSGNLRYYLYTKGFNIVSEVLVPEGKFICEIITAVPTGDNSRTTDIPEEDIRWKYPDAFIECNTDYLQKRLDWKFSSIDEEIKNLKKSNADNTELINRLRTDRNYLENLLQKNINYHNRIIEV